MIRDYDHGSHAWGNCLNQFRNKPVFESFVKALYQPMSGLHKAFFDLQFKRGLDTAEGVQLDRIGDIVGLKRTLNNAESIIFFGFEEQTDVKGFGQARLRRAYERTTGGSVSLPDYEYRMLLKWKIAVNNGHGTAEEVINAMRMVFDTSMVRVFDAGNAKIQLVFNSRKTPKYLLNNMRSLIPKAAGVGIEVMAFDEEHPFGFEDQGYQGFDEGVMLSESEIVK